MPAAGITALKIVNHLHRPYFSTENMGAGRFDYPGQPLYSKQVSTPRIEEYLEAIYKLAAERGGAVGISRLAQSMGLSVPSASEMVKRLEQSGSITYNRQREVVLTDKGREEAVSVIRRHRLAERFLTDHLGFDWDEVHEEACRLEHAISPAVEAKLAKFLGEPQTCPHGYSIPQANGEVPQRNLIPLTELEPGKTARVAAVPEEEAELLRYLAELGLIPKAEVKIVEVAPFGGPMTLTINGASAAVGPELASKVLVES